jgi:hypothetical protein
MIDILQADAGFVQAIFQRIVGETGIVLLAREAFLLRGGDDLAVTQQGGGAVVIEGGNTEDMHAARSKESVDEGRHRASLCQDNQRTEHDHHDEDGQQPVFLAGAHERPEFLDEGHEVS